MTMPRPVVVKALAAVFDEDGRLLVQTDLHESFYRLPGGTLEFGETAQAAVTRELHEEYRIGIRAGRLLVVIENQFSAADGHHHELALVHHASLTSPWDASASRLLHLESEGVQLIWRDFARLQLKLVPKGLDRILHSSQSSPDHPVHLVVEPLSR